MNKADTIIIRHAKTEYTNEGLDLTSEGVAETEELADELSEVISTYDEIIVLTSPLARAKGTAQVFMQRLEMKCSPREMSIIRCVDIFNQTVFDQFNTDNSTPIYGQMWFNHPELETDTEFAEGRSKVNNRAQIFLRNIAKFARKRSNAESSNLCVVVFTHFEVASNYLRPLYNEDTFPAKNAPGLRNSEHIFISVGSNSNVLTIKARGIVKNVTFSGNKLLEVSENEI